MTAQRTMYRPILLTKAGELDAVGALDAQALERFAPIFAVHPATSRRSPEEHLDDISRKVAASVPGEVVTLDTTFVDAEHDDEAGPHPLIRASEQIEASIGLGLVPVVARAPGSQQVTAAAEVHRRHGAGACLRLPGYDDAVMPHLAKVIPELLDTLGVEPAEVDLMIDMATDTDVRAAGDLVAAASPAPGDPSAWRSVTLAASAFPETLGGLPKNEVSRLPRTDWALWLDVAERAKSEGLPAPDFGDYGVGGLKPPPPVDGRVMTIPASLRYSGDEDWLVAKGEAFSGRGGQGREAVPPVARMIASHAEFRGADFSAGDRWIAEVAAGTSSETGNPSRWRWAGTNHHITLVTRALSTLTES